MAPSITYPCLPSGEPRRISAGAIAVVAAGLRAALFGPAARPVSVEALVRRTQRLDVNGSPLRLAWDLRHAVHDRESRPVLGICEHDPSEPGTILISLNGELLGGQPELLRSTAAHELGHAVFDMPAAIARHRQQTFSSPLGSTAAQQTWREWRADEFMGAFLAPRHQLARAFARCLRQNGVEPRWRMAGGIPSPFAGLESLGACAFESILDSLCEQFGVSQAFIGVRLTKYGFIR